MKLIRLLEAKDPVVAEVALKVRDLFPENAWWGGKCAGFAFGLHAYLSGLGVKSRVFVNADGDHVFVMVGKAILDACRYNVHDKTPTTDVTDTPELLNSFDIPLRKRDVNETIGRLSGR